LPDANSYLDSTLFKIRGYIGITSPVDEDEWNVDSTDHVIHWTKRGPVTNVNVYYQYNMGAGWSGYTGNKINTDSIPAENGPTTGCPWTIPNHITDRAPLPERTLSP